MERGSPLRVRILGADAYGMKPQATNVEERPQLRKIDLSPDQPAQAEQAVDSLIQLRCFQRGFRLDRWKAESERVARNRRHPIQSCQRTPR